MEARSPGRAQSHEVGVFQRSLERRFRMLPPDLIFRKCETCAVLDEKPRPMGSKGGANQESALSHQTPWANAITGFPSRKRGLAWWRGRRTEPRTPPIRQG